MGSRSRHRDRRGGGGFKAPTEEKTTMSYAEAAKKASGNWRKPRMKVYDPNQEREEIYMPDKCEVISDKYSNMRYSDKSSTDLELEDFLVKAYKKQIKEL